MHHIFGLVVVVSWYVTTRIVRCMPRSDEVSGKFVSKRISAGYVQWLCACAMHCNFFSTALLVHPFVRVLLCICLFFFLLFVVQLRCSCWFCSSALISHSHTLPSCNWAERPCPSIGASSIFFLVGVWFLYLWGCWSFALVPVNRMYILHFI